MRFALSVLTALGLASPVAADPSFDTAFAALSGAPAISAGYVHNDSAPYALTKGVAQKGGAEVAPDARWHVGSITKSFTAALILRMELDLDAPLNALVPDMAAQMHRDWQSLTLRELLSHTSGMVPNPAMKGAWDIDAPDLPGQRAVILARHWGEPLPYTRGTYRYSNLGYVLAGHIAETIAGTPYEELVVKDVTAPLGLASVGFGAPRGAGDARGHRGFLRPRSVAPDDPYADNPAWLGPAGTMHMTLADLLEWGRANMEACLGERPAFLTQEQCAEMHVTTPGGYGLGWEAAEVKNRKGDVVQIQGHSGSNTMWMTNLFYDPESRLVMVNSMNRGRMILSQKHLMQLWQSLD